MHCRGGSVRMCHCHHAAMPAEENVGKKRGRAMAPVLCRGEPCGRAYKEPRASSRAGDASVLPACAGLCTRGAPAACTRGGAGRRPGAPAQQQRCGPSQPWHSCGPQRMPWGNSAPLAGHVCHRTERLLRGSGQLHDLVSSRHERRPLRCAALGTDADWDMAERALHALQSILALPEGPQLLQVGLWRT